ncbi:hypothetical protein EMCG_04262 [[Emmonsia] crescens]|uniref:FAD dependent oxidoreductase domain-containing protein n=1 Tax=[Emmonsia] crescens TaxID=73230 RepID=A0A0G2HSL6_9EURO|nr:hypothetical protein EMCG_04262 [Emmonsia crescens UAMH 3008]
MTITFLIALKRLVVWSFVVAQNFSWPFDSTFDPDYEVLIGDVCIIGGGAPDTCAAIRLHDLGKKVIVVEQRDTLGGHMHSHGDYENRTKNRLRGRRPGCY